MRDGRVDGLSLFLDPGLTIIGSGDDFNAVIKGCRGQRPFNLGL